MTLSRVIIDQQFGTLGIKMTPTKVTVTPHILQAQIAHPNTYERKSDGQLDTSPAQHPAFEVSLNSSRRNYQLQDIPLQTAPSAQVAETSANAQAQIQLRSNGDAKDGEKGSAYTPPAYTPPEYTPPPIKPPRMSPPDTLQGGATPRDTSSPEITMNKQEMFVDWQNNRLKIEWGGEYLPTVTVDSRASVEVFLRNHPKVTITVEEYELGVGNNVDEER